MIGMLYFIGRGLTRLSWWNYLIPNRYWRLILGKHFGGTFRGIPIYRSGYLEDETGEL